MFKRFIFVCTVAFTAWSANAALIAKDLYVAGDGLITYDTNTHLEWLDLTETRNLSYDDVSAQLVAGGQFEGWSYATFNQVDDFYKKFGIASVFLTVAPNSAAFVASWNSLVNYVGDISTAEADQSRVFNALYGIDFPNGPDWVSFTINRLRFVDGSPVGGQTRVETFELTRDQSLPNMGSYLVRVAEVPLPAAAWFFGSGLLGLSAVSRRSLANGKIVK